MLTLNLYKQFSKKENSTAQPGSGALTLALSGILKDPCSILNPVIRLTRFPLDAAPFDYTYAKWVEFGKYYFIDDWSWNNGFWEVHLREDILATFKTQIGTATEYVLRTDSTVNFNGDICDTTYPTKANTQTETLVNTNAFTSDLTSGCYIVGIISGGSSNAVGAISYYAMTSTEFGALKNKLFSNDNLEIMGIIDAGGQPLVTDLSQEVLKTLYNPYQYIASCMWFPFGKSLITSKTPQTEIKIGWWPYPLTGDLLYAQTVEIAENELQFVVHPQAATRGNYLNYSPYSDRYMVGRFGTVVIDSAKFNTGDRISVSYKIDLITGQCLTSFERKRTGQSALEIDLLSQREFLIGVPIQIAQVGTDYLGTSVAAISTAGNAIGSLMRLDVGGAISGAASGIYNTIQSAMPQVETSGQNGSFLAAGNTTYLVNKFYQIVDEDISHRGRPLCELRQLNTLSGYILCADGELDISALDIERKEIQRYLTTGFFME